MDISVNVEGVNHQLLGKLQKVSFEKVENEETNEIKKLAGLKKRSVLIILLKEKRSDASCLVCPIYVWCIMYMYLRQ